MTATRTSDPTNKLPSPVTTKCSNQRRLFRWLVLTFIASISGLSASAQNDWQTGLPQKLALLGHRNWIVIADAAYPQQTASGIETICTDASQLQVVQTVLEALRRTKHVQPIIYTDAELKYVPEKQATGITAYRDALTSLVGPARRVLPHDQLISKLNETGNTFHVIVLKSKLCLPYTSVFIQLDCAYWSATAETELRAAMKEAEAKR